MTSKLVDVEANTGIAHLVRTWYQWRSNGTESMMEYAACKYPVSGNEVEAWLRKHGFEILEKLVEGPHSGRGGSSGS